MNTVREKDDALQTSESQNSELAMVVEKNIDQIVNMRLAEERKKRVQDRVADALTRFSGSMTFVYAHVVWFGLWFAFNFGLLGNRAFDPFPFSLLTLIVSLEAIFLSTFVLVSQNHANELADKRAELDLQINLLSEHEITHLLHLVDAIADHLGIATNKKGEIEELKKDVSATEVVDRISSKSDTETR